MNEYLDSAQRRRLLRMSGAGLLGPVGLGLFGSVRVATAQPLSGPVPEVDRLAVTVVTDSYHHAFEPTRKIGDLQVQRFAFALSKAPPAKALQNEWVSPCIWRRSAVATRGAYWSASATRRRRC